MAEIAGLNIITPSNVTYAGTSASIVGVGTVQFSAVTQLSVAGIFSSTYDNYLIVFSDLVNSIGGAVIPTRMMSGTTPESGTNYSIQRLSGDGSTVTAGRWTGQNVFWGPSVTNTAILSAAHMYLYGPNLAQPTAIRSVEVGAASSAYLDDKVCLHSLSSSYDGLYFIPSSYNISGRLSVYGLAQ